MCTTCYREANYQRLFKRHISEYWNSSLIQGVMLLPFLSSLFHPQQKRLFYICFQVSTSEYCARLPAELGSVLCRESHYVCPRTSDLAKEVAAKRQPTPAVYTVGDAPVENIGSTNIRFSSKKANHHGTVTNPYSQKPLTKQQGIIIKNPNCSKRRTRL